MIMKLFSSRRIEEDGKVNLVVNTKTATGDSEDVIRNAGQIRLVNFQSPQYLRRVGNGFLPMDHRDKI